MEQNQTLSMILSEKENLALSLLQRSILMIRSVARNKNLTVDQAKLIEELADACHNVPLLFTGNRGDVDSEISLMQQVLFPDESKQIRGDIIEKMIEESRKHEYRNCYTTNPAMINHTIIGGSTGANETKFEDIDQTNLKGIVIEDTKELHVQHFIVVINEVPIDIDFLSADLAEKHVKEKLAGVAGVVVWEKSSFEEYQKFLSE